MSIQKYEKCNLFRILYKTLPEEILIELTENRKIGFKNNENFV